MTRLRLCLLAGVVVLGLALATVYFVDARRAAGDAGGPGGAAPEPRADEEAVLRQPHVVFRNTELGSDYGKIGVVALDAPGGPRAVLPVSCERLYATAASGVCVSAQRGVAPTYALSTLNGALQPTGSTKLVGLPSRARMSPDGSLVSTTNFVGGHSYAQASFATETIIRRRGVALGNLESWRTTLPDGTILDQVSRNFWGVTFAADDDRFFATAASGDTTWLVQGSIAKRTMRALRTDAECPSLSPDATMVAYKKRLGNHSPGAWRLAVFDFATQTETLLSETRSVDDQVEWLDNDHVLYALTQPGAEATSSDVWLVSADGSGAPTVLIDHASSPAVVRG